MYVYVCVYVYDIYIYIYMIYMYIHIYIYIYTAADPFIHRSLTELVAAGNVIVITNSLSII